MCADKGKHSVDKDDIEVDISFEPEGLKGRLSLDIERLTELAKDTASRFLDSGAVINIVIADDALTVDVNLRHLGRDSKTDVISFDLSEADEGKKIFDILVNADQAQRQAKIRGHEVQSELALYIVHGILHNCGFDDASDELAEQMHRMEDVILSQNGFGKVYSSGR